MKTWLRKKIRKKLKDYQVPLNSPDLSLPEKISERKTVVVIGGGIAGLSAAANLAERGFEVTLFEKDSFLCGKMGAWNFESNGEKLNVEHGFHAFFRQYHNLRGFMKNKLNNFQHLVPIDDYVVLFKDGSNKDLKISIQLPG
jgi:isorenieratene synthase